LKHAFDCGINTWDTADTYSNGASERLIRKAIETYLIPRSQLVLMTKCYFGVDDDPSKPRNDALMVSKDGVMANRTGLSRKHIFAAVEASVERLGTYIDVLQIHRLDDSTPPKEIMRALNDVVERGWVRYIAASSMACWQLQSWSYCHHWTTIPIADRRYRRSSKHCSRQRVPRIHFDAELLQPAVPRGRA